MTSSGSTIYHIAFVADWEQAVTQGGYRMSTRGRTLEDEGFIHASTSRQVAAVANSFYADAAEDALTVLVIDPDALTAPLRYEMVEGAADPFPHIYGPLDIDAVTGTLPLAKGPEGWQFVVPAANQG